LRVVDFRLKSSVSINGQKVAPATYLESIKKFHTTSVAKLITIEDLSVSHADSTRRASVVAQLSKFTVTSKTDGKVVENKAVTIVKVEEREGRRVMTMLTEAQD
jgi:hypothetical protein